MGNLFLKMGNLLLEMGICSWKWGVHPSAGHYQITHHAPFQYSSILKTNDNYHHPIMLLLFSPGPGSYNISGMGSESMRKAYIESTRRGIFGSTAMRIQPMMRQHEVELPGPAHYQIKEKPFKQRFQQPTSNFASLSTRLPEHPLPTKVGVVICDRMRTTVVMTMMRCRHKVVEVMMMNIIIFIIITTVTTFIISSSHIHNLSHL